MVLKKCKRSQTRTKKTFTYKALFQNESGQELLVVFNYSPKTEAVIPNEVLLNKVKFGGRLREALDAVGIEELTVDFLNKAKKKIDKHYLKKAKKLKETSL
jgi:hypothetical protein